MSQSSGCYLFLGQSQSHCTTMTDKAESRGWIDKIWCIRWEPVRDRTAPGMRWGHREIKPWDGSSNLLWLFEHRAAWSGVDTDCRGTDSCSWCWSGVDIIFLWGHLLSSALKPVDTDFCKHSGWTFCADDLTTKWDYLFYNFFAFHFFVLFCRPLFWFSLLCYYQNDAVQVIMLSSTSPYHFSSPAIYHMFVGRRTDKGMCLTLSITDNWTHYDAAWRKTCVHCMIYSDWVIRSTSS